MHSEPAAVAKLVLNSFSEIHRDNFRFGRALRSCRIWYPGLFCIRKGVNVYSGGKEWLSRAEMLVGTYPQQSTKL